MNIASNNHIKESARLVAMAGLLLVLETNATSSIAQSTNGAEKTKREAHEIEQKAREYLQPLLHVGESITNLVEKFGPPSYQYETQTKELCLYFLLRDSDQKALVAGVGGFTAFFTSNRLTHWDPVYETRSLNAETSSIKHTPVSFHSDKTVFAFCLVSEEAKEGSIYIDEGDFPKLGYVNKSPDLAICSGAYTASESADRSRGQLDFVFSPTDAAKLKVLTTQNVGKRMALVIGSRIVAAPYIQSPISDGRVTLTLPSTTYTNVFQALKGQTN